MLHFLPQEIKKYFYLTVSGSEKFRDSSVAEETLIESNNINKSLLVLGEVFVFYFLMLTIIHIENFIFSPHSQNILDLNYCTQLFFIFSI